jgi:hypothetical protein
MQQMLIFFFFIYKYLHILAYSPEITGYASAYLAYPAAPPLVAGWDSSGSMYGRIRVSDAKLCVVSVTELDSITSQEVPRGIT